jgi:hypothetical protein
LEGGETKSMGELMEEGVFPSPVVLLGDGMAAVWRRWRLGLLRWVMRVYFSFELKVPHGFRWRKHVGNRRSEDVQVREEGGNNASSK